MLQKMGVPIRSFRVATNQNDILYRLFTTGEYSVGDVHPSLAPSMDIQVASNFERFIYFAVGRDPARVREVMQTFKTTGRYKFENFNRDTFTASRTTDAEISSIIQCVHREYGYVCDPHTACGFKDVGATASNESDRVQIVLATASPAKFPDTIKSAIGLEPTHPSLEALKSKPIVKHRLPAKPDAIRAFINAHAVK
jgi:threonine synthase